MYNHIKRGDWVVLVCAQRVPRLVKVHAAFDETVTVFAAVFGNGRPVYEDFDRATGLGESAFGHGMRRIALCDPDDSAHGVALSLAVLTWIADTFDADRETARACIALDTLVRFSAARGVAIPPLNAAVVENVMPVDYAQHAKARAELDAWMREGVKALHAPQPKVQR